MGLIPGLGRSLGVGNGNQLQYSCPENDMDGGNWWTTVHVGHKESDTTEHAYISMLYWPTYAMIKTAFSCFILILTRKSIKKSSFSFISQQPFCGFKKVFSKILSVIIMMFQLQALIRVQHVQGLMVILTKQQPFPHLQENYFSLQDGVGCISFESKIQIVNSQADFKGRIPAVSLPGTEGLSKFCCIEAGFFDIK